MPAPHLDDDDAEPEIVVKAPVSGSGVAESGRRDDEIVSVPGKEVIARTREIEYWEFLGGGKRRCKYGSITPTLSKKLGF